MNKKSLEGALLCPPGLSQELCTLALSLNKTLCLALLKKANKGLKKYMSLETAAKLVELIASILT